MPTPQNRDEATTIQQLRQISAQLAALSRVVRRVLDLDESDEIDKELLTVFRDAFAYAVKMKNREAETEVLLQWVRQAMKDGSTRRASWWGHARTVTAAIIGAIATALAARYLGGH